MTLWILEIKFYKITIKPSMFYELDCWTIKKSSIAKFMILIFRMFENMCEKILKDKLWIISYQKMFVLTSTKGKRIENILGEWA